MGITVASSLAFLRTTEFMLLMLVSVMKPELSGEKLFPSPY